MKLFPRYRIVTINGIFIVQVRVRFFEWAGIEKIPNVTFTAFSLWYEQETQRKYCSNKSIEEVLVIIELYKCIETTKKLKVVKYV